MVKNYSKKILLTDLFDDEPILKVDEEEYVNTKNIKDNPINNKDDDLESPTIEFIIEKDENDEKQVRLNFEFQLENSKEVIKLDLEISKNTYLELADELLK